MKRILLLSGVGKEGILSAHILHTLCLWGERPDVIFVTGTASLGVVAHKLQGKENLLLEEYFRYKNNTGVEKSGFSLLDSLEIPLEDVVFTALDIDKGESIFFTKNQELKGEASFSISQAIKGCLGFFGVPFVYQLQDRRLSGKVDGFSSLLEEAGNKLIFCRVEGKKEIDILYPKGWNPEKFDVFLRFSMDPFQRYTEQKKMLTQALEQKRTYITQ